MLVFIVNKHKLKFIVKNKILLVINKLGEIAFICEFVCLIHTYATDILHIIMFNPNNNTNN